MQNLILMQPSLIWYLLDVIILTNTITRYVEKTSLGSFGEYMSMKPDPNLAKLLNFPVGSVSNILHLLHNRLQKCDYKINYKSTVFNK